MQKGRVGLHASLEEHWVAGSKQQVAPRKAMGAIGEPLFVLDTTVIPAPPPHTVIPPPTPHSVIPAPTPHTVIPASQPRLPYFVGTYCAWQILSVNP